MEQKCPVCCKGADDAAMPEDYLVFLQNGSWTHLSIVGEPLGACEDQDYWSMRAKLPKFTEEDLVFTPHHHPSQAILRAGQHFALLKVRCGNARRGYLDDLLPLLNDIEAEQWKLNRHRELLALRGAWWDDKHGGMQIFIDLVHERKFSPTLTEESLKDIFHDGYTVYSGAGCSVEVRLVPTWLGSDGFFLVSDEYYDQIRERLHWKS